MAAIETRQQCMVYLITYSRADFAKVPTRQRFADIVVNAFEQSVDVARVSHWVVSQEDHQQNSDDDGRSGKHYHMAVKLTKRARWARVRGYLESSHEIRVNFSANHNTYYSAYQYVTKDDKDFVLSNAHPELRDPPTTENAIAARKAQRRGKKGKRKRSERYSTFDVVEVIQHHNITTRLELVCLAMKQKDAGKTTLAEFIANRGSKVIDEALFLAKEFKEAPAKFVRTQKSRLQLLSEAYDSECASECQGRWMECGLTLLRHNEIPLSSYCDVIYKALQLGRGKYRNVYIFGPANTGKTFMISPLKVIYNAFNNPATGTFAWVGAEEAEVVLLNDFRWHPSIIAWGDLLQLLEGDTVHLPAPKNFSKQDIEFTKDTPFFATADAPLVLVKGGFVDHANTQMMEVRWRCFNFWRQIPQEKQQIVPPCPRCFARLIIDYKSNNDVI